MKPDKICRQINKEADRLMMACSQERSDRIIVISMTILLIILMIFLAII
jgi:hypothetical protein